MSFVVRMKKRKKMVVVRVLCVLMIAVLVWFLNWDLMQETLAEDHAYLIFWALIGVFLLLFAFTIHVQRRPRIEVDGQDITFYPKWGLSKKAVLSDITSRKEQGDFSSEQMDAAVGGMLLGGLFAYALKQRYANALRDNAPKYMAYTYYSGTTKLITVSTRDMENVERFDQFVVSRLEGKPLEYRSAPAVEEPVKKGISPLLPAGLAGVVCVLAVVVAVFVLSGKDNPTPPVTSADPGSEQVDTPDTIIHSAQGVAFAVSPDWTQAEGTDMFYTDKDEVYGLNGVSPLGSYEPQAFFEKLSAQYNNQFDTFSAPEELAASMNSYIPGGSRPSDYLYATGELKDNRERYQVCLDTFYAVILHNQRLVSSPEDVREGGNSVLYIGFYLPELEMADLTNCNAMSNTQWTFQEKTA